MKYTNDYLQAFIKLNDLYSKATIEQRHHGNNWYYKAYLYAKKLANKYELPIYKVVGIISALSPNNKWERNLLDAELFLENPLLETKVCTYTDNRIKAQKIYGSNSAREVYNILGGRKTKSFYENILRHDNSKKVTVDLWIFRAGELPNTAKNYQLLEEVIQDLAKIYSKKPHQVQAVIWGVIRDMQNETKSKNEIAS